MHHLPPPTWVVSALADVAVFSGDPAPVLVSYEAAHTGAAQIVVRTRTCRLRIDFNRGGDVSAYSGDQVGDGPTVALALDALGRAMRGEA